jgi:hypothetical protein
MLPLLQVLVWHYAERLHHSSGKLYVYTLLLLLLLHCRCLCGTMQKQTLLSSP